MARKLLDIVLGRSEEEAAEQDIEKVKSKLESSHAEFDVALVRSSQARQQKTNGLKKATEALRLLPVPKPVPSE